MMQKMAGTGYLKICVSIVVIFVGVIVVVSIGFVHRKVQRVERMITSKRSDVDSDGNIEMTNSNSGSRLSVAQVIPDSNTRVNSMTNMIGLEEGDRITLLEDIVQTILKEREKWMKDVDKKMMRNLRAKRAVDDSELVDRNKTKKINANGDYLHTHIGSAVYIRWGRSLCPKDTELVYDGVTAGSHFDLQGSSANTLCLPKDPVWGKYAEYTSNYSMIFGAEYRLSSMEHQSRFNFLNAGYSFYFSEHQSLFKHQNAENLDLHNVPCALCSSQTRTSVFMLPGRNLCYKGWHTEYHGYLTGPRIGRNSSSDYLCVDEAPEADPAGYREEGGKLLFPVEAVCGSLPCPPYVAGWELTCAVCSK